MIFSPIRLSELRQDVEIQREKFHASVDALKSTAKTKANPLTFLKDHPKLVLGFLLSAASTTRSVQKLIGFPFGKKRTGVARFIKMGWLLRLGGMGSKMLGKAVVPVGIAAVRMALKSATKALRNSRN